MTVTRLLVRSACEGRGAPAGSESAERIASTLVGRGIAAAPPGAGLAGSTAAGGHVAGGDEAGP